MKRFFKIFGITLAALVGVVVIAAAVIVYVVFTPARLTPVVQKVAADYISCEYNIGSVDLTFFSTFPEFGLRADGLLIINPTAGAPSDTLLEAKKVVARIDLMRLLNDGDINIHEVALSDVCLMPYIAADGTTNFDILSIESDTTEQDTTEGFIKSLSIDDMAVSLLTRRIVFIDEKDSLSASVGEAQLTLAARKENDMIAGALQMLLPGLSANYKGVDYVKDADIEIQLPYMMRLGMEGLTDIHELNLTIDDGRLGINEFELRLDGDAALIPEMNVDMTMQTGKWHVSDLLALVPQEIFTMPADIRADGYVELLAHAKGVYNDSVMPLVDAHIVLSDAEGEYKGLPYQLKEVNAEADAHLDLNDKKQSAVDIQRLSARTKESTITASGTVTDLLGDMLIDVDAKANVAIKDLEYFMPDSIYAEGKAKASVKVRTLLSNLTDMRLDKGSYRGSLTWNGMRVKMPALNAEAETATLSFSIPNVRSISKTDKREAAKQKNVRFLDGTLGLSNINVKMTDGTTAVLGQTDVDFQLSDVLKKSDVIYAMIGLRSADAIAHTTLTDSLGNSQIVDATLAAPAITAYAEYDTKDTLKIPVLSCTFNMHRLDAVYDTISVHSVAPQGTARISGGRRDKTQPRLSASLSMNGLDAAMGAFAKLKTGRFAFKAAAQHTDNKENILLEWQPRLQFDLSNAVATVSGLEPQVKVPEIKFAYSNKKFTIDTSRVELGHSDFSLSGEVHNIGPWLEKKDLMLGTLNFVSSHADINELLSYVSGAGNDEEELSGAESATTTADNAAPAAKADTSASEPFIVPKGVDLTLNTHIKEADAFGQHLSNLGGRVFIRDGVLILEEMGFICEAAKLQLTAMYKTPRRNHIFVGFDYHMTDINVEELVDMIPQVDSMLPMLRSFKGAANFHLAAETYVNSKYQIKPSTIRGACSINAKDLTLLDGETFTKIAKILTFNKKTENKIDSISAEIAIYKKEIDIYPFLITCDKWMAAVGGQHNLDMTFDYHLSLLNPLYLGVDVSGTFDDLKIRPAKCRYAKDFKPIFHREIDTRSADIRSMIRKALESNVRK
ncbi:MAG: hypothetical protein IJS13_09000 [Paludibacteraceae bacterium]|nr:hypothetical protein [Paludibacteraceae bacterium]